MHQLDRRVKILKSITSNKSNDFISGRPERNIRDAAICYVKNISNLC